MENERRKDIKLMGQKLPATILTFIILQTIAAIWWASALSTTVNNQGESIKELRSNVAALTSAKVVVLEAEVARLQAELIVLRNRSGR